MMFGATVLGAASWRLASELARRHPGLIRVCREHPGDGQYDVLALRSDTGVQIMLNRLGTIQVHGRHDDGRIDWEPTKWTEYLSSDPREFVKRLEAAAGLPAVGKTPVSTPTTLVYRVMATIAATSFMTVRPVEIVPGYIDTSGYDGGPAGWFDAFSSIDPDLLQPRPGDPFGEPGYRFWMCKRSGLQLAFETSSGNAWPIEGGPVDLMPLYQSVGRDVDALALKLIRRGHVQVG